MRQKWRSAGPGGILQRWTSPRTRNWTWRCRRCGGGLAAPWRRCLPERPISRCRRSVSPVRMPVAQHGTLCASCWSGLRLIEKPYCARLGIPFAYDLGPNALSAEAIADPPPFDRCRAVAAYDGVARDLVHGLKYRDRLELAAWMANWMRRAGADIIAEADVVVPVPLHRRRLWHRRFNQAAELARMVAAGDRQAVPLRPRSAACARRASRSVSPPASATGTCAAPSGWMRATRPRLPVGGCCSSTTSTRPGRRSRPRPVPSSGPAPSGVDVLVFARVVRGQD